GGSAAWPAASSSSAAARSARARASAASASATAWAASSLARSASRRARSRARRASFNSGSAAAIAERPDPRWASRRADSESASAASAARTLSRAADRAASSSSDSPLGRYPACSYQAATAAPVIWSQVSSGSPAKWPRRASASSSWRTSSPVAPGRRSRYMGISPWRRNTGRPTTSTATSPSASSVSSSTDSGTTSRSGCWAGERSVQLEAVVTGGAGPQAPIPGALALEEDPGPAHHLARHVTFGQLGVLFHRLGHHEPLGLLGERARQRQRDRVVEHDVAPGHYVGGQLLSHHLDGDVGRRRRLCLGGDLGRRPDL